MAKYELKKKTDTDGEVCYYIYKDGFYIDKSYTRNLTEAEEMFAAFSNGKSSEPIIEIIKTIEVDEN